MNDLEDLKRNDGIKACGMVIESGYAIDYIETWVHDVMEFVNDQSGLAAIGLPCVDVASPLLLEPLI